MPDNQQNSNWDLLKGAYNWVDQNLAGGALPGGPGGGDIRDVISQLNPPRQDRNMGPPTPPGGYVGSAQNVVFGTDTDQTWDWNPLPDADDMPTAGGSMNGCNLQVMVAPHQQLINKAPKGYVIVETQNASGATVKVAMLKPVAKSCGLWKPRAKPVMTAADAKTIRRAASLQNKVDRLAKMSNSLCSKAPLRRVRSKR